MMTKLPKQWNHWVRDSHLLDNCMSIRKCRGYYLRGRGHYWRVAGNTFQISEPVADFDRWANSLVGCVDLPQTKAEFRAAVDTLLETADLIDRLNSGENVCGSDDGIRNDDEDE